MRRCMINSKICQKNECIIFVFVRLDMAYWEKARIVFRKKLCPLRKTQIVYKLGSLAFSFLPGIVADRVGSYVPTYYMFAVFSVFIALMISVIYRRVRPKNMW